MTSLLQSIPSPMKIREELEQMVLNDLLGPVGGPEEEIDEPSVRDRYLVGMLAPKRQELSPEEFDELPNGGSGTVEDGTTEVTSPAAKTMFPSSFGMTFCVGLEAKALQITARWGHYHRDRSETLTTKSGDKKLVWKRIQREAVSEPIPLKVGQTELDARRRVSRGPGAGARPQAGPLLERHAVPGQRPAGAQEAARHGLAVPARTGRRVARSASRSFTATPIRKIPARAIRSRSPRNRRWRCSIAIRSSSASGTGSASTPTAPTGVCDKAHRLSTQVVPTYEVPAHHAADRRRLAQAGRAGAGHEGAG